MIDGKVVASLKITSPGNPFHRVCVFAKASPFDWCVVCWGFAFDFFEKWWWIGVQVDVLLRLVSLRGTSTNCTLAVAILAAISALLAAFLPSFDQSGINKRLASDSSLEESGSDTDVCVEKLSSGEDDDDGGVYGSGS